MNTFPITPSPSPDLPGRRTAGMGELPESGWSAARERTGEERRHRGYVGGPVGRGENGRCQRARSVGDPPLQASEERLRFLSLDRRQQRKEALHRPSQVPNPKHLTLALLSHSSSIFLQSARPRPRREHGARERFRHRRPGKIPATELNFRPNEA